MSWGAGDEEVPEFAVGTDRPKSPGAVMEVAIYEREDGLEVVPRVKGRYTFEQLADALDAWIDSVVDEVEAEGDDEQQSPGWGRA